MKKPKSRRRKQAPLLEIRKPLRVRVYRGKFRSFEWTKYLDQRALKATKKATIACGTVEAAGFKQAVSAEIYKGMIVALKPDACDGCEPKKSAKIGSAALKKAMRQVRRELADRGIDLPVTPVPLRISRQHGFEIPIGPIIIIFGDPAPGGIFDICFEWWNGDTLCWWCLIGSSGCITFG